MPSRIFLFLFLLLFQYSFAQSDSVRKITDTVRRATPFTAPVNTLSRADSILPKPKPIALSWQQDTAFTRFFINKNFPKNKQSVYAINEVRRSSNEDEQFYILAGLLLFTGIVRTLFPKYFAIIFGMFFQSSNRQKQSKENLTQEVLPSLLMNLIFILSGGLLMASFARSGAILKDTPFLLLWLYACGALLVVYLAKSLFISLFGWSFGAQEPASHYKFTVFLINKVAGLLFLPLLLILLYADEAVYGIVTTLAWVLIAFLLIYRYIVSLNFIGKRLKINPLHFFLYLCAVEILPLLLTYKVLLITKEL